MAVTEKSPLPNSTISAAPVPPATYTIVYHINRGEYFTGRFLPTIVASFLAIFIRTIRTNIKLYQPWHALTHDSGTFGRDSLCHQPSSWQSILESVRLLVSGNAVYFLTYFLSLLSTVLVPLSAEAITLDLRGDCEKDINTVKNCAWVLSAPAYASEAAIILLVFMAAILALVVFFYSARSRKFKLEHFQHSNGRREYGIILLDDSDNPHPQQMQMSMNRVLSPIHKPETDKPSIRRRPLHFFKLGYLERLSILLIVGGVLILALYYSHTTDDTGFEHFINSGSFGVRFLFASFGVLISLFWSSFFDSNTYRLMASKPQPALRSILLAPPTNTFSGFWHAVSIRSLFFAGVNLASVFSEFLGIFLINVPFQVTETFLVFQISSWISVGILSSMVVPHLPVDPRTISGAMYYVCDSSLFNYFGGLGGLEQSQRDEKVMELNSVYEHREMKGFPSRFRVGADTPCQKP
ncbi:hypothetical protein F4678DRAFT_476544 [Xylaria arbuscula]|nr:hypothetical protein F4678DRAFT_476544 [Xylaria arbuscula]